jgi:hypothetical protein
LRVDDLVCARQSCRSALNLTAPNARTECHSTPLILRAGLNGFRAAFVVIFIAATLGAITAAAFERQARRAEHVSHVIDALGSEGAGPRVAPVPLPVEEPKRR